MGRWPAARHLGGVARERKFHERERERGKGKIGERRENEELGER